MNRTRREFIRTALERGLVVIGGTAFAALSCKDIFTDDGLKTHTGKRWGMAVDLLKCMKKESCVDCIAACHLGHNVPDIKEVKHAITWIWKDEFERVLPNVHDEYSPPAARHAGTILLCNHCANPPCVRVCPARATWKREDGIVVIDQHRCIGCRYCMAACPYGSRSFNWSDPRKFLAKERITPAYPTRTKGTVEKCEFCVERVDRGQGLLCVGACKEKALLFGDLNDPKSEVRAAMTGRTALRRKSELGTGPAVYYLL
ncbi:MAG: 4Fe-4S dicluster domain-containing protein [Spirochaetes bacterium]|nr:MAG: 4Fe-4S dicluster domain-containing protein [Spirochaetota bacterium]